MSRIHTLMAGLWFAVTALMLATLTFEGPGTYGPLYWTTTAAMLALVATDLVGRCRGWV